MSSVADAPLASLCRDATPETVAAFVADLYEARGWTVDRQGERRILVSADGRQRRVGIVHPADRIPTPDIVGWADTVVAIDGPGGDEDGVDVVDAATLRQQLAYAIDRPVALQLLESHFGWTPPPDDGDGNGGPVGSNTTDAGGTAFGPIRRAFRPAPGRSRVFVATVVLLAAIGGVVAMAEELDGRESGRSTAGVTETPTPTPTGTASPTVEAQTIGPTTPRDGRHGSERFSNLPPGVNLSGEIDRRRLVEAHESTLENESYRLSITYRESIDGRPTGLYTESIRVANDTRYSATVTSHGTLRAPAPTIADTDVYANGSVRFERINGSTVERGVVLSYDRFLAGQTRFLSVFLDVRESAIVDYQSRTGRPTTYIVTTGNPATLVRNATGSFDVREDGLVTRARWTYGFSRHLTEYDNVTATFGMRVSDVGSTTVREPDWVSKNGTRNPADGNGTRDTVSLNRTSGPAGVNGTSPDEAERG